MIRIHKLKPADSRTKRNTNFNGGGQECPPHTGIRMKRSNTSLDSSRPRGVRRIHITLTFEQPNSVALRNRHGRAIEPPARRNPPRLVSDPPRGSGAIPEKKSLPARPEGKPASARADSPATYSSSVSGAEKRTDSRSSADATTAWNAHPLRIPDKAGASNI